MVETLQKIIVPVQLNSYRVERYLGLILLVQTDLFRD